MKQYLIILITLLNLTLSFSQSNNKLNESQKIEIYRKIFWDSLPKSLNWTNDYENLFTDKEEDILDSIISDFNSKTGVQIAIVTLDTICTSKQKFDDLTLHIANTWGVGEKIKNNGILIGISRGHRKIRIQNGYGIEKIITDLQTKEIIDNYFIPNFKKNEYFIGTSIGLTELINLLLENNVPEKPSSIPNEAFWKGGIDGGYWFFIGEIDDNKKQVNIKIFDDFKGELLLNKTFELNCNVDIDLKNLKNEITFFNGNEIYLKTEDNEGGNCYLK